MRILVVHSIYRPYKKGGAEVVVERFVDELKKKHEVTVLTVGKSESRIENRESRETPPNPPLRRGREATDVRGTPWNRQRGGGYHVSDEDGVKVIRFVPFNIFSVHDIDRKSLFLRLVWHALDVWNIHSWFVMRRVLKTYQPDVVWTHTMKGIGYLPFKAINIWKGTDSDNLCYSKSYPTTQKRWIFTPHNEELIYQFGYGMHPFKVGVFERVTMFFTKWFTKDVNTVLAPSRQIIKLHEKYGFWKQAEKISLWPCFVEKKNLPFSSPPLTKGGTNSPVEGLSGVFTFGFIGQIEEHKGIKKLVKSFQSYQNQQVRLFVAGRGNLVRWVQEQTKIDSRMELYGEYRQDELEKLFSKISVLVVPSLIRDNMPTVILEAFAHGRPVIGSPLGGIPEILGYNSYSPKYCYSNKIVNLKSKEDGGDGKGTQGGVKGLLLEGFQEKDFHDAFDRIQKPEVYKKLVDNIKNWKPVTIQEVVKTVGL